MYSLALFAFVTVASAAVMHNGQCPDIKAVENFDVKQYSGVWYEISRLPTVDERSGKCGQAEYTPEGDMVKVKNSQVLNGVQQFIEGTAKLAADANKAGKLVVTFKFGEIARESPLWILGTDYKNYAVAYSCRYDEATKNHQTTAWVLSRTKKLEGDAKAAVDKIIADNSKEIDSTKFIQGDFSEEACKFTTTAVIGEKPKKV